MTTDLRAPPVPDAPPQSPKFSRYRSVRKAAVKAVEVPEPTLQTKNEAIARSRSRYRKRPAITPVKSSQQAGENLRVNSNGRAEEAAREIEKRLDKIQFDEKEFEGQRRLSNMATKPADTLQQSRMSDGRPLQSSSQAPREKSRSPGSDQEKRTIDFFSTRKPIKRPPISPEMAERAKLNTLAMKAAKPRGCEPGGGVGPGIDAPVSAVNAGERRVTIRCQGKSINLPVTPETTPIDLIHSAATVLTHTINVEETLLLESYVKVGLERPIRKYEHIRDIMNSWDRDSANELLLMPVRGSWDMAMLEASSVPKERPEETSLLINYSHTPGKWKKQWVTLRADGQMLTAKKQGAKETTNICHLSDFDIYIPTPSQLKKVVKSGKKHCFAVKSQQKSTMFMSQTTFVHFFATDDNQLAQKWHSAIQSWRSWYLVHRLGEGQESTIAADEPALNGFIPTRTSNQSYSHVPRKQSADMSRDIGSLQPKLPKDEPIPLKEFNSSEKPREHSDLARRGTAGKPRVGSEKRITPPLTDSETSLPARSSQSGGISSQSRSLGSHDIKYQDLSTPLEDDSSFSSIGLLGRTYSQRQQAQNISKTSPDRNGTPIHNSTGLIRTKTRRSTHHSASSSISRSKSQRHPPMPLLDFSDPAKWEPPQHSRKGHGYNPDESELPSKTLIDAATSPEVAVAIPPSSLWRKPTTNTRALPARHKSQKRMQKSGSGPFIEADEKDLFTGLLAQTGQSQGGMGRGRGVMTGNRTADKPMLDVTETSTFAPGSLLASVEGLGSNGVVIDRQKRIEKFIEVGESAV